MCAWRLLDTDNDDEPPQLMMLIQGHVCNVVTALSIHKNNLLLASACPNGILNMWSLVDVSLVQSFR